MKRAVLTTETTEILDTVVFSRIFEATFPPGGPAPNSPFWKRGASRGSMVRTHGWRVDAHASTPRWHSQTPPKHPSTCSLPCSDPSDRVGMQLIAARRPLRRQGKEQSLWALKRPGAGIGSAKEREGSYTAGRSFIARAKKRARNGIRRGGHQVLLFAHTAGVNDVLVGWPRASLLRSVVAALAAAWAGDGGGGLRHAAAGGQPQRGRGSSAWLGPAAGEPRPSSIACSSGNSSPAGEERARRQRARREAAATAAAGDVVEAERRRRLRGPVPAQRRGGSAGAVPEYSKGECWKLRRSSRKKRRTLLVYVQDVHVTAGVLGAGDVGRPSALRAWPVFLRSNLVRPPPDGFVLNDKISCKRTTRV